ncbi:uncharacterized protein [Prorops nasuta]|uniref:uncharacterized protein n=1 Tax=Prorops nasuta TaxID=863751 RepID=UPI0034CE4F20
MDGDARGLAGEGLDLGGLEGWWNEPGIAAWSLVLFGSIVLNAILLLAFLFRPGLRTISNRFVMNLTVSNLLTCAILSPLLMLDAPLSSYAAEGTGSICAISEGATALVTTSSVLSVLLIAIDQYFAVVDPLRYRSRIDKLKTGILILGVWVVSLSFGIVAALNPQPRSLWLSCTTQRNTSLNFDRDTTISRSIHEKSIGPHANRTVIIDKDWKFRETLVNVLTSLAVQEFNDDSSFTIASRESASSPLAITYGLIYSVVYSVFAYLVPFVGVCWIYISIYSAAHKNSERTRRTGSRPILSCGSFCYEEQQGAAKLQPEVEEFRRIPKISSLSSIDETSETTQTAQPRGGRTMSTSASDGGLSDRLEEDGSSVNGVVFTVGSHRLDVSPQKPPGTPEVANSRIPVSLLKAEFLEKQLNETGGRYVDLVRSRFNDGGSDRRRKSSHDLMYEELLAKNNQRNLWVCEESESEGEVGLKDTLEVPEMRDRRGSCRLFTPLNQYELSNCLNIRIDQVPFSPEFEEVEVENVVEVTDVPIEGIEETGLGEEGLEGKSRKQRSCSFDGKSTEASTSLLPPIVTITPVPNKAGLQRTASVKSTSSYINSLKHRISNGSLFKYREETRAARVSALVIVMGLICWSPYVILLIVKNVPEYSNKNLPHSLDIMALSFHILATYVTPLLFGYRSKRVKRELRKFFCFRKELSYKNNRSLMAKKVLKRRHSSTLSHLELDSKYNIFNCVYGRSRWPKEKVQFVQVPDTALGVETCRSSFSSGASTQISSTSTEEC